MRRAATLLGLLCLVSASAVAAVGHYDGVLGATSFDEFPGPGEAPATVTTRLVVEGSPADGQALHEQLVRLGDPGQALHTHFQGAAVVPARFEGDPARTLVLLRIEGDVPPVGQALVVRGPVQTLRADLGQGQEVPVTLVVLLDSYSVHKPLVF